jgi:hypothetical protein
MARRWRRAARFSRLGDRRRVLDAADVFPSARRVHFARNLIHDSAFHGREARGANERRCTISSTCVDSFESR